MKLQRRPLLTAILLSAGVEARSRWRTQLHPFLERLSSIHIETFSNLTALSSQEMKDFGVVYLFALVGLMLSIVVSLFDYGADIAPVMVVVQ